MRNQKTLKMVQTAILLAILLLMSFTPLGYLKLGALSITMLAIPVAIGGMLVGPAAGTFLGFAFGVTSFSQVFIAPTAFGLALFEINPFFYFINTVVTRTLMGFLTSVIFRAIKKADKTYTLCYFAGGFLAAFINTVLFMGCLILLYWNTDTIQTINQTLGNLSPLPFVVAFVGVNGALEWPTSCIISGLVSKGVTRALHMHDN